MHIMGATGESALVIPAIKLPENLEGLNRADHFPCQRHRWNTNEEIAAILINFGRHPEWLSKEVKIRPKSGSMLLYCRKKVRYRRDGYCWKKRKDGKTTREDHMKLKVQGTENPDIVLVHYLNVPYPDDNKLIITSNVSLWGDKKEWTKEELISQLKPMFFSEEESDHNNELEISTAETVESIVLQLMEKQRIARSAPPSEISPPSAPPLIPTKTKKTHHSSADSYKNTPKTQTNLSPPINPNSNNINNNVSKYVTNPPCRSPIPPPVSGAQSTANAILEGLQQHRISLANGAGILTNESRPFLLNLSQFHSAGGLIILNGKPALATAIGKTNAGATQGRQIPILESTLTQNGNNLRGVRSNEIRHDIQNGNISGGEILNEVYRIHDNTIGLSTTSRLSNNVTSDLHLQNQSQNTLNNSHNSNNSHNNSLNNSHNNTHNTHNNSHNTHSNSHNNLNNPHNNSHNNANNLHNNSHNSTSVNISHKLVPITENNTHFHSTKQGVLPGIHQLFSNSAKIERNSNEYVENSSNVNSSNVIYGQETLDMSHEDIQRTLQANMSHIVNSVVELEPMSPSADDVLGNLDAFDLFGDLSDEMGEHHAQSCSTTNSIISSQGDKNNIVDINPDWAYSEGGTKILIVGQFYNSDSDYMVHFGDFSVPAVYLQTGVLKCFCPPHSPGLVPVRVFFNGKLISTNSMVFEYRTEGGKNLGVVPVPPSETSLKLSLIHRIESLEKSFRNFKSDLCGAKSLEDCVVRVCIDMMSRDWSEVGSNENEADRGLSLMHLTAALGYTRLLFTLLEWRRKEPPPVIVNELQVEKVDAFGLTPLMWCARYGHVECGIILAHWSPESLLKRDPEGQNPIQIAVSRGFTKFASELEKVESKCRLIHISSLCNTKKYNSLSDYNSNTDFDNFEKYQRGLNNNSNTQNETLGSFKDCFFGEPESRLDLSLPSEEESRVLTLAEQIIAAIPDRIKKESLEDSLGCESQDSGSVLSGDTTSLDFGDRNYRYYETGTPCSSLSPSSSCLESPCSSTFTVDSPGPTTADFCQFLHAASFEKDFSNLTLSDQEQRELYEAAQVIQKAYRSYKGRRELEEKEKEKLAAIIIQNYYRRYKEYAYLKQVTHAALVIQNQYRNYCEAKRCRKSEEESNDETKFRLLRDNTSPFSNFTGITKNNSQRRQNQAARKIQQFMLQSKNNWDPLRIIQAPERACRKREAVIPVGSIGHCPAKVALSSNNLEKNSKENLTLRGLLSHHHEIEYDCNLNVTSTSSSELTSNFYTSSPHNNSNFTLNSQ